MTEKNYQFGGFFLDTASRSLLYQGKITRLSPRAFKILLLLIENQGRVVKKEDLIEKIWSDSFVEENNLPVHISALRRVLKEHDTGAKHIETVSGSGYKFLTFVRETGANPAANFPLAEPKISSIAVLPFINRNAPAESDYLAEGITDTLISNLSKIAELKVISYSAVAQYKNQQSNLREVGFLLGVDSILTGSVIEMDGELEIRAELVRVSDLAHLWGTKHRCKLENIFKTKTEISIAIVDKLQIKLTKTEEKQLTKQPTENSEAYRIYLKGKQLADTHSKQGLLKSIDYFNEAIKIDSNFALAYTCLGYVYLCLGAFFYAPTKESIFKSELAIETSLTIDGNLAEAYAIRGYAQLFQLNLNGAKKSFEKAIELNPNNFYAHGLYSNYFLAISDFNSALEHQYKYVELNPHPKSFISFSLTLMLMGEFQKAIDNWESNIELFPNFSNAHYGLAVSYGLLGKFDTALRNAETALK